MKRLLVIDPANVSGVAVFDESGNLECSGIVRARGKSGEYLALGVVCCDLLSAWTHVYAAVANPGRIIIERGFGSHATAIDSQGMHYGMHRILCAMQLLPDPDRVNVSEWRRVIREGHNVSWPRESDRCKELSVSLCRKIWGRDMTADEADACLLGLAAIRMGMAETGT